MEENKKRKVTLSGKIIGSENIVGRRSTVNEEPPKPNIMDHVCIDVCDCGWMADVIDKENAIFKCPNCGLEWTIEFWDVCRGKYKIVIVDRRRTPAAGELSWTPGGN